MNSNQFATHTNGNAKQDQRDDPRKIIRRTVKPGSYAIFKKSSLFGFGKPRMVQTAEIIDISSNGLRVQYSSADKWSIRFDHISIADAGEAHLIDNIHCTIISDAPVANLPDGNYARVCGIKFDTLSFGQIKQLEKFIHENTVEPSGFARWSIQFA